MVYFVHSFVPLVPPFRFCVCCPSLLFCFRATLSFPTALCIVVFNSSTISPARHSSPLPADREEKKRPKGNGVRDPCPGNAPPEKRDLPKMRRNYQMSKIWFSLREGGVIRLMNSALLYTPQTPHAEAAERVT